jgi:hypothetical protein
MSAVVIRLTKAGSGLTVAAAVSLMIGCFGSFV